MLNEILFPLTYKGGAKEYVVNVVIPSLPSVDNVIKFNDSLLDYVSSNDCVKYIRKFKDYKNRSSLYTYKKNRFTVTDNEPALWFFMEVYKSNVNTFTFYETQKAFPVAFALTAKESNSILFKSSFKVGKQPREKNFSALHLKHCHILDCSPKGHTLKTLSINQRMMRLISPMNHFPFPSFKKHQMEKDYGEDVKFRELIISLLLEHYYKSDYHKDRFLEFLKFCGENPTKNKIENFPLSYKKKSAESNYNIRRLQEKGIDHTQYNTVQEFESSIVIKKTRFYVDEEIFNKLLNKSNKFLRIEVQPKRGKHRKGVYIIPRQAALDFIKSKIDSFNWSKNKCFHQDGIPSKLSSFFVYEND